MRESAPCYLAISGCSQTSSIAMNASSGVANVAGRREVMSEAEALMHATPSSCGLGVDATVPAAESGMSSNVEMYSSGSEFLG